MDNARPGPAPSGRSRVLAASSALLLLTVACATAPKPPPAATPDIIVLLPDAEGKSGAIVISSTGGGERLLSEPGQAVTVQAGAVPGEPFVMTDEEVQARVGPALQALPPPPLRFILHFLHDTAELTPESRARLREILRAIRERAPVEIGVVGHTDRVGSRRHNRALSLERARTVAALLKKEGLNSSLLAIDAHGEDNPLVPTADEVPEPRNRRVEVTVR